VRPRTVRDRLLVAEALRDLGGDCTYGQLVWALRGRMGYGERLPPPAVQRPGAPRPGC
jgi:hypothetical protein